MSALLLSLLLIALVAIGLLMASTKIRESFVNPPADNIVASPVLANLLSTPNLQAGSPQVNTISRDGDLQKATDAGSPTYSAVGKGDASTIHSLDDLTPYEANYLKMNRAKENKPLDAPPDSKEKMMIAMARENGKNATQNILKGDYSVTKDTLTMEESLAILDARKNMTKSGPPSNIELMSATNMRRMWADAIKHISESQKKAPTAAVNDEEMPDRKHYEKKHALKEEEDYEDDYPVLSPSRRRRDHERSERHCPKCEQCPDMSQYIKLDEIPCWNCSLP
jgi:hypothetical protein